MAVITTIIWILFTHKKWCRIFNKKFYQHIVNIDILMLYINNLPHNEALLLIILQTLLILKFP